MWCHCQSKGISKTLNIHNGRNITLTFESAWQNWGLANSPSKIRHMLNLHLDLIGMHQLNEVEDIEDCLSSKPNWNAPAE